MIVKIIKCSYESIWYKKMIGCTFKVINIIDKFYIIEHGEYGYFKWILEDDCEILENIL